MGSFIFVGVVNLEGSLENELLAVNKHVILSVESNGDNAKPFIIDEVIDLTCVGEVLGCDLSINKLKNLCLVQEIELKTPNLKLGCVDNNLNSEGCAVGNNFNVGGGDKSNSLTKDLATELTVSNTALKVFYDGLIGMLIGMHKVDIGLNYFSVITVLAVVEGVAVSNTSSFNNNLNDIVLLSSDILVADYAMTVSILIGIANVEDKLASLIGVTLSGGLVAIDPFLLTDITDVMPVDLHAAIIVAVCSLAAVERIVVVELEDCRTFKTMDRRIVNVVECGNYFLLVGNLLNSFVLIEGDLKVSEALGVVTTTGLYAVLTSYEAGILAGCFLTVNVLHPVAGVLKDPTDHKDGIGALFIVEERTASVTYGNVLINSEAERSVKAECLKLSSIFRKFFECFSECIPIGLIARGVSLVHGEVVAIEAKVLSGNYKLIIGNSNAVDVLSATCIADLVSLDAVFKAGVCLGVILLILSSMRELGDLNEEVEAAIVTSVRLISNLCAGRLVVNLTLGEVMSRSLSNDGLLNKVALLIVDPFELNVTVIVLSVFNSCKVGGDSNVIPSIDNYGLSCVASGALLVCMLVVNAIIVGEFTVLAVDSGGKGYPCVTESLRGKGLGKATAVSTLDGLRTTLGAVCFSVNGNVGAVLLSGEVMAKSGNNDFLVVAAEDAVLNGKTGSIAGSSLDNVLLDVVLTSIYVLVILNGDKSNAYAVDLLAILVKYRNGNVISELCSNSVLVGGSVVIFSLVLIRNEGLGEIRTVNVAVITVCAVCKGVAGVSAGTGNYNGYFLVTKGRSALGPSVATVLASEELIAVLGAGRILRVNTSNILSGMNVDHFFSVRAALAGTLNLIVAGLTLNRLGIGKLVAKSLDYIAALFNRFAKSDLFVVICPCSTVCTGSFILVLNELEILLADLALIYVDSAFLKTVSVFSFDYELKLVLMLADDDNLLNVTAYSAGVLSKTVMCYAFSVEIGLFENSRGRGAPTMSTSLNFITTNGANLLCSTANSFGGLVLVAKRSDIFVVLVSTNRAFSYFCANLVTGRLFDNSPLTIIVRVVALYKVICILSAAGVTLINGVAPLAADRFLCFNCGCYAVVCVVCFVLSGANCFSREDRCGNERQNHDHCQESSKKLLHVFFLSRK